MAFPISIRIPQTSPTVGGQTFSEFLAAVPARAIIPFEVGATILGISVPCQPRYQHGIGAAVLLVVSGIVADLRTP